MSGKTIFIVGMGAALYLYLRDRNIPKLNEQNK